MHGFASCGCARSKNNLQVVTNQILIDLSHTSIVTSVTGIQNYVLGISEGIRQVSPGAIYARFSHDGYQSLSAKSQVIEIKTSGTISKFLSTRFATVIKRAFSSKFKTKIKDFLYRSESENLILVPLNCRILLPESILEEWQIEKLVALSHGSSDLIMFLHDAFPITHPSLVSTETKIRASAVMSLLSASKMISCQSEAVASVARHLIGAVNALMPTSLAINPIIEVHRRPIIYSLTAETEESLSNEKNSATPTVLAVGTIEPRKDYLILMEACEKLWSDGLNFKLQIIGGWGWKTSETHQIFHELSLRKRQIHVASSVTNMELDAYFKNAHVFVYPSLAEGVGLPPGEAYKYGLKAICRRLPSLLETFGGTGLNYFDGSVEDLAKKIKQEIESKTPVNLSLKVAQESWTDSAHQILNDLEKL